MEIIISIPIILKLVGRSNEIKHKKDLMQYKNCDVPSNLHSYLPKKTQFVREIRHETMRKKCKPMERQMLAGIGGAGVRVSWDT